MPVDDWTEPGIFEVAPGVHRIPLPLPNDGLRCVNVYAIVDVEQLILIDSGWALQSARERLERALREIGCEPGDVKHFFVTHAHRDHYTQAVALRRIFGTPISIGRHEAPSLRAQVDPARRRFSSQIDLLRLHGAADIADCLLVAPLPSRDSSMWEMPDAWFDDGQEIHLPSRTLRVIHTPGHTRGHVVFLDESAGLMFSGDHVLPHITPSIGFEPIPAELPLNYFLKSLHLVRSFPDAMMLPAHGPVGPSVHQRCDEILLHHDRRLSDSLSAIHGESRTASDVARGLTWTGRSRPFSTLDLQNQMLAILETAAHLDVLVMQGRASSTTVHGVRRFTAVEVE